MFARATKKRAKLRFALHGPSGSGKTFSALNIGRHLVGEEGRIAVVDTERGSASKYSDLFEFDTCEVVDGYHPDKLGEMIAYATREGYDLLIIDSLSHFWNGTGGFLELVDEEVKRMRARGHKPDSFGAWKSVDPVYKRMISAILNAPMHVILTMRAKQEYVKEEGQNGKIQVRKVGMAPEMRENFQYEADVEGMLDMDHNLVVGKTRCVGLDGHVFSKPGKDCADILRHWLQDAAPESGPELVTEAIKEWEPMASELCKKIQAARTQDERVAIQPAIKQAFSLGMPKIFKEKVRKTYACWPENQGYTSFSSAG